MEQLSLDDLVLWRLAKEGLDGITQPKLSGAMKAYCPKAAVHESCSRLVGSGLAAIEKGKRSQKYRATSKGLERVRKFVDPGKTDWRTFQEKYLPAHCCQITVPAEKSGKDFPDAIRSSLLRHLFKIPIKPGATLKQTVDALLANHLGQPVGMRLTQAILLHALSTNTTMPEDDLESFASIVRNAMDRTQDGWVGSKIFISRVWNTLVDERRYPGMTLIAFKSRLLEANQRELLTLSRADMAPAHDPADVTASEIRSESRTFHFLVNTRNNSKAE